MFKTEEEVTIEKIDFEWVSNQTKVKTLKKAQRILKDDGGYYPDLEKAIQARLEELDPSEKQKKLIHNVDPQTKKIYQEALFEWENEIKEKEKKKEMAKSQMMMAESIFDGTQSINTKNLTEEEKRAKAEIEKIKGNEALKSGDLKEALQYYTKSIHYSDKLSATFCNRALVYLKLKDYKSAIADCNKALELQPDYIKALHRRGKAHLALENYEEAIRDFQEVMNLDPNNSEVNADLMDARKKYETRKGKQPETKDNKQKGGAFKKIQIQEESDSDEEQEKQQEKQAPKEEKPKVADNANKMDKMIDNLLQEEQKSNIGDKLKKVEQIKEKGSQLIKDGKYESAIKELEQGLNILNNIILSGVTADTSNINNQKASLFNNIALCYMQMDMPSKVIEFTSRVIELKQINQEVLIKAHIRRALAYEKLDKLVLAHEDYEEVKHLNPGNMQASEGLRRIHEIMRQDPELGKSIEKNRDRKQAAAKEAKTQSASNKITSEEQVTIQPIVVDLESLEKKKGKGNDLFREKNYPQAKSSFESLIAEIESYYSKNITTSDREKLNTLYLAVLSNAALTAFYLNQFEDSLAFCEKALGKDPNHQKCLYRKSLCKISLADKAESSGDEISRKKKQLELYEEARVCLETLLKIDNKNKEVKDKLSEIIGIIVKIRKEYNFSETKTAEKNTETPKKEEKKEPESQNQQASKKTTSKPDFLEKVQQSATEQLISSQELPENFTQFELNCQSFKKNYDKLYHYIKKIPTDHLVNLYKKQEIGPDLLMNIIRGLNQAGVKDDPVKSLEIIEGISKTHRFEISIKQITKSEKKELKQVLEDIRKSLPSEGQRIDATLERYNCKE